MACSKTNLLLAAVLLAIAVAAPLGVSASDPTAPRAPVCAINGSDGAAVPVIYKTINVAGTIAVESVAVASPYFLISFDFGPGSFTPIAGETVIQYAFFEEEANSTTWANGSGKKCKPSDNGLYFFVVWGNTTAGSTLPAGTTISFTELSVTIRQPMLAKQTPWWGLNVPIDSFCIHNKPGGARLASRIYEKATVSMTGVQPACVEDSKAVDSLLPFTFICRCAPPPPGQGGGGFPPPNRGRSPPPPSPSFLPPCGINGTDGVITDTVRGTAPINDAGAPAGRKLQAYLGDAAISITLNGSNFIIIVDFGPTSYIPIVGSTVFQYYFFESSLTAQQWIDSGDATTCNPAHDGLFFYIKWGTTTSPTAPDGTTISFTATAATIIQPIITDKLPFMGGNNSLETLCLHIKEGGIHLAYRIYEKQGVVDVDANYPGTFPNCAGLLSGGPADQIAFTFQCVCPPDSGGGAPPPKRRGAPPPGGCPVATSPASNFDTEEGVVLSVSQSFPLIGGGTVTMTLTLPGVSSASPAFGVSITFTGATLIAGTTKIQYKFFEGYNTPVNQPPGFTGGFNVQLAGKGSNCASSDDSLLYSIRIGNANVTGYTSNPAPPITYTASGLTFTAPIKDASFPAFNLNANDIKSLCCHQKDGGTVFGIRIFNAPDSTGTAPCPEDLLALAIGNFNFQMDCTCPASGRKMLSIA